MRVITKHIENSKSYHKENKEKVTRIEVQSELYDFDLIYHEVINRYEE